MLTPTQINSQLSALSATMADINATLALTPSVTGADMATVNFLLSRVNAAASTADTLLANADATMDAEGASSNFISGTDPVLMAAALEAMSSDATQLATVFALSNTLGRLSDNIASIAT